MRLVLIGDIHAARLRVPPWRLLGKRFLGQLNLWLRRRHRFDLRLLPPVLERAASLNPDLMLLSGDLSTTALRGEFEDVSQSLAALDGRVPIVIVPGNHDRYTFASARQRTLERVFAGSVPQHFPDVRPLAGSWRLLCLDASKPRILSSRGRLGSDQLNAAQQVVSSLSEQDGLVVICHYPFGAPPHVRMLWDHRLADDAAFEAMLANCRGRVLLLHGHVHEPWCWQPDGAAHVLCVNAGSPTMHDGRGSRGHGFWQMDLPGDARGDLELVRHEPAPGGADWASHRATVKRTK